MNLILNVDRFFDPEPSVPKIARKLYLEVNTRFGADKGCDIPLRTKYTRNLHALLNKYGNEPDSTTILRHPFRFRSGTIWCDASIVIISVAWSPETSRTCTMRRKWLRH